MHNLMTTRQALKAYLHTHRTAPTMLPSHNPIPPFQLPGMTPAEAEAVGWWFFKLIIVLTVVSAIGLAVSIVMKSN